jgi:1,2-dihydroxy-3-keto-5-methylthiopentene dioxygenase
MKSSGHRMISSRERGYERGFKALPGDQRLQHDSGRPIDIDHLRKLGVRYWTVPLDTVGGYEAEIDRIAKEQGYKNRDVCNVTKEGLGDLYETKLKSFFDEWVVAHDRSTGIMLR